MKLTNSLIITNVLSTPLRTILFFSLFLSITSLIAQDPITWLRPVSVSSYRSNAYSGEKAIDSGSGDTWWEASNSTFPQWIEIDFEGSYSINDLYFYVKGRSSEITDFKLEAFDNTSWVEVLNIVGDYQDDPTKTYTYTPMVATKIRLTIYDIHGNHAVRLRDIDVTGTPAALPPTPPLNIVADNITSNSFNLSWTAPASGADSYVVNLNGTDYTTSSTSYSPTGLSVGTAYSYTVASVNTSGQSAPSAAGNITTLSESPTIAISNVSTSTADLSWSAMVNANHYLITVEDYNTNVTVSGFYNKVVTGLSTALNNLNSGTRYRVISKTVDSQFRTSIDKSTYFYTLLETPVANAATNVGHDSFQASWNAIVGANEYRLSLSNGQDYTTTNTSIVLNGLSSATQYTYIVTAIGAVSESASSNQIIVNTDVAPPSGPPTSLSGGLSANVSWMAVNNATSYNLYVSEASDFSTTLPGYNGVSVSGASADIHGLSAGKNYFLRVQAVNSGGISGFSETFTISTSPLTISGNTYNIDGYNLGIGTNSASEKLEVNGTIRSREVIIEVAGWPDYVFEEGYNLQSLKELEEYIKKYKHLPDVPSAETAEEGGVQVGNVQKLLLQKIEELVLYTIQQQKVIESHEHKYLELLERVDELAEKLEE